MSLKSICDKLNGLIDKARKPIATIPAILLICSAIQRPGMSAMLIASKIVRRAAEIGIPTGTSADGSTNLSVLMEKIRVEEMVYALKMDSRVQVSFPIGSMQVMATGSNSGGPVVCKGFNINMPHGDGIIG